MLDASEYWLRAEQCRKRALTASPETQGSLLMVAQSWEMLARQAQHSAQLKENLAEKLAERQG
jgi:hypothetical protein